MGQYYQDKKSIKEPEKVVSLADKYFEEEGEAPSYAVDLGSGTGRHTLFLLSKGWKVLAIDKEQRAIDFLLNQINEEQKTNLDILVDTFSNMVFPSNLRLIIASLSLPFCDPKDFQVCWEKIVESLSVGGRFSGHFFGERDQWANSPDMTFHTEEQFRKLFEDRFVIEYLQIEEGRFPKADGEMKQWHRFHVVAKKVK